MQTMTKNVQMSMTPISQFLSLWNMERLESLMTPQRASHGAYLFWEGEKAEKLFYVKSGAIKLVKTTEDGRAIIVQIAQAGDLFGEFGDLGEMTFGYDGTVLEEAELGVISLMDLENLMRCHGDFALEFVKWLSLMQRTAQSRLRDLLLYGKSGALASTILRLSESCGERTEQGIRITIRLTHTDLAHMIGSTRESVNRLISDYRSHGVMDFDRGQLVIRDLGFFRDMVGGAA